MNRLGAIPVLVAALGLSGPAGCSGGGDVAPDEMDPPGALALDPPIHHVDVLAREPMVVEHPTGALFASGYPSQVTGTDPRATPRLWRSDDGGSTWQRVDVGTASDGAIGNSDVDLAVGPEGTLYFVTMGFDRTRRAGTHVAIGVSHDVGATWTWSLLSETEYDDRPWIEIAPDGTAHAVWNDGAGVSHAVSTDRGRTWEERERIHGSGGSSHLAIGPDGQIAVRVTPASASGNRLDEDVDLVAVSTDGGETWAGHPAPGHREWDITFQDSTAVPRWVEPVAWDESGALYSLWSEGTELFLARSEDGGKNWQTEPLSVEEDVAYFPYLVARGEGELAATWFTGTGEALRAHAALIHATPGGGPTLVRAGPFRPQSWVEDPQARVPSPAGEYVPVVFLADGSLAVVTPLQDVQGGRFGFTWWRMRGE